MIEEKEILEKLNDLKNIKPDKQWKNSYREILYSQISAGQVDKIMEQNGSFWAGLYKKLLPRSVMIELSGSVWVTIILLVILFSGSTASIYASRDAKPGDSLYLAKIIGEQAKLAITFDEKSKAKLNLEFASNRAQEITQVISDTSQNANRGNSQVEQLSQSFKKEITEAKNRLSKINMNENNNQPAGNDLSVPVADGQSQEVFGANLEKDNQRMEISEPKKEETKVPTEATATPAVVSELPAASSTPDIAGTITSSPSKILDEAEKLFDEKNYNGTIDKLQEANQIIDQSKADSQGEVKGAEDSLDNSQNASASSTP